MTEMEATRPSRRRLLAVFRTDESGATAIEYAIIASGIGGVLAITVFALGGSVTNLFTTVSGLFP
jgi:pilus assembly protein Flp/PilA